METLKTEGNHGLRLFVMLFAENVDSFSEGIGASGDECPQRYLEHCKWENIHDRIIEDESRYPDVFMFQVLKYVPTYSNWVDRSEVEAHAKYELLAEAWMDRHRKGDSPEAEGMSPDPTWDYFMGEVIGENLVRVCSTVAIM